MRHPRRRRLAALATTAALLAGACSSGDGEAPDPDEVEAEASPDPAATGDAEDVDADTGTEAPEPGGDPGADGTDADDAADDAAEVGAEPPAPEVPATPVPATRDDLVARLGETLEIAEGRIGDAELTVLVVDEAGREVAALEPEQPMLPASTLKIVTAAAALTTLGRDGALTTVVDATGGIGPDGVLDGDLLLVGGGDPTLSTDEYGQFVYPARPRTSLTDLADQLVAVGLTAVTGDVVGIAPGFDGEPLPTGWRDAYLSSFDGRYTSGLTVDGGLRTLVTYPDPPEPDDDEDGDDGEDGDADPEDAEAEDEDVDPDDVDLGPPDVRVELATDPAANAASELARLLDDRGIEVAGDVATEASGAPVQARLAAVASAPLVELLRFTVQRSDNHLADQLFWSVGRTRTGAGDWERGARALTQVLERFGVPTDGAVFADGSGLSRDDRVTARLLVELDRAMTADPRFGADWRGMQAVTGVRGTLERRLAGTVADGRFFGKTGTLRDVTGLVGQVITADADPEAPVGPAEQRYHLAVLANDADGEQRAIARAVMDDLILALTADLDGCEVVPAGSADGPLGRPPVGVRC